MPVAGAAEECQHSSGALRRAEAMSRTAGSIGAVAFCRSGDPMVGEFSDARVLKKFGKCRTISAASNSQLSAIPGRRRVPRARELRVVPAPRNVRPSP